MRSTTTTLIIGSVMVLFAATACSSSSSTPSSTGGVSSSPAVTESPEGTTVGVTMADFSIDLANATTTSGEISFDVKNDGPSVHEFVVLQTDLAPDALPVTDEQAAEEGDGIVHEGEVEDIASGQTQTLALRLDPGNYVLVCNLTGHYELGMRTGFTVT